MAVSSIKGCWCKFSARIREYLDVVDSYYRPGDLDCADGLVAQIRSATGGGVVVSGTNRLTNKKKHQPNFDCNKSAHHNRSSQNNSSIRQQVTTTKHQNSENLDRPQLPPGFRKKKSRVGQIFFVASNGEKFWYDPSVPKELIEAYSSPDLDSLVGKLKSPWEIKQTPSGKTYYANHSKKTTQFTDPRLVEYKDYLHGILKQANKYAANPNDSTTSLPPAYQLPNAAGQASSRGSQQFSLFARPRPETINTTSTATIKNDSSSQSQSLVKNNQVSSRNERTVFANRHTHHHHHHHYHNHGSLNRPKNAPALQANPDASVFRPSQPLNSNQSHLRSQYQMNLFGGSHHNLSTSNNQSATLTRIPGSKLTSTIRANGDEIVGDASPCDNPQTTSKVRSNQRSGSFANLTSLTANNFSKTDTVDKFIRSNNNHHHHQQQQVNNKVNQKELFDKISILRQELLKQQVIAHPCRIDVSRKRIFEESFRVVSQLQPRDLKKRLLVKFKGEEGLDYGGVAREWFYLLSRDILNPAHGLFQYTSDDIYNLQINPDSGIVYREHLSYLNFCGRIIGMAVFHGHFIEGHFTLPFYKMLLKKPISLGDIEFVDPELYRSLCWMLENDITEVIDTTFLVQHNAFGQLQELELKEGGRNITVTEENKHEYVSLYVNYRCRRGIESQMEALQRGFYELIAPSLVENFDEAELELLIGGLSKINVDDWKRHTKLKNCTLETPLVGWFWDIVRSYGEDKRARLLQFVTGSPRVPIQGFKALQGVNSELRLFTIHLIKNACTNNLPKSHTCFNRIDLPPYETYDKLRDKLTQAIEETMGFAMQ